MFIWLFLDLQFESIIIDTAIFSICYLSLSWCMITLSKECCFYLFRDHIEIRSQINGMCFQVFWTPLEIHR